MQGQLAVYKKWESYRSCKTRYEARMFRHQLHRPSNASTSCCGSKDVHASNGGPFEEFIPLLSSVFLKKR